jgi:ferric-dicitrate binding protein FerR (iron transport regulator)
MKPDEKNISTELLVKFLAGEASQHEAEQIRQWQKVSEENQRQFDEFKNTWELVHSKRAEDKINLEAEWNRMQQYIDRQNIKRIPVFNRGLRLLAVAASIIVISSLGVLVNNYLSVERIATGIAEVKTVTMPDRTVITLNADSRLTYSKKYGETERTVKLSGEAFFEVEPKAEKPFHVNVSGLTVKVLGTTFNVQAPKRNETVNVAVVEGIVAVSDKKSTTDNVVTAGEALSYRRSEHSFDKKRVVNRNFMAWKTKHLVFENMPLEQVIQSLQDAYHVRFVIQSESLKRCTFTGEFNNQRLGTIVTILQSSLDLNIEQRSGVFILTGSGCE